MRGKWRDGRDYGMMGAAVSRTETRIRDEKREKGEKPGVRKKWYRLDTAALIFPAIARRNWSNVFRLSATLREEVDGEALRQAAEDLRKRFPTFYVTLRRGFFWYYLEEMKEGSGVRLRKEFAYPLTFMSRKERKTGCLRVIACRNRIAAEFFHSVTDGSGGRIYLCNLVARYLEIRHGIAIPPGGLIRDLRAAPEAEEMEDSFLKNAAPAGAARREERAFHLRGTRNPEDFKTLTTGIVDSGRLVEMAHAYGVSVTAFLAAVLTESLIAVQNARRPLRRQRPVKITVPVNLRRFFPTGTLRNFALALNVGVDPRFGDYSLEDLCRSMHHQLGAGATRQNMAGMIAANVLPQRNALIRLTPVGLKNLVMDRIYVRTGEAAGSINLSNLGETDLPEEMRPWIERMEFIIGPQRSYPNNCSVISCGGKTCIQLIRNIREAELERRFFSRLVELGLEVTVESNGNAGEDG